MNQKPTTIEAIKQAIENAKTIQRLEQITIENLERDLERMEAEELKESVKHIKGSKIIKHLLIQPQQ